MTIGVDFYQDLNQYQKGQIELNLLKNFDIEKNRKNDDWKYTKLETFFQKVPKLAPNEVKFIQTPNKNNSFFEINFNHNQNIAGDFTALEQLGITFKIQRQQEDRFQALIHADRYYQDDFLNILNNSYQNALIIEVQNKSKPIKPILLKHTFNGKGVHFCYQTILSVASESEVSVLEELSSDGGENYINFKTHVELKENAKCIHTIAQNISLADNSSVQLNAQLARNSHYNNCTVTLGSNYSRSNLCLDLTQPGATCDANGLYLLKADQHHDTMSFIQHSAPHTFSNQLYKGILDGSSRGIFTGKVRVSKDAQLIDAKQLNKNLLLTPKAHANSRPQMEIYADDVKCAHGSTTGQISDDEMFYFTSRGIEPTVARKLLAQGYSNDVILKIKEINIQKYISDLIHNSEDK